MEKTYKFKQEDIVKNVDISSAQKHFDLKFDQFGPYSLNYSRNGRHLLIGGKKGHIGAFDWQSGKLSCEIQLGETVRDVQCVFLFFSVSLILGPELPVETFSATKVAPQRNHVCGGPAQVCVRLRQQRVGAPQAQEPP